MVICIVYPLCAKLFNVHITYAPLPNTVGGNLMLYVCVCECFLQFQFANMQARVCVMCARYSSGVGLVFGYGRHT